ncbi:hypothetical protein E2C01_067632 [Portunus trituberculatus]|uniref:Uncharacterized protein n=1 Tax=Portunus trituberculatus TaxID=210409 RepID=A0A5B7HX87_PORTR|nr:hypothetical protein [Portunus trituberculatus]
MQDELEKMKETKLFIVAHKRKAGDEFDIVPQRRMILVHRKLIPKENYKGNYVNANLSQRSEESDHCDY